MGVCVEMCVGDCECVEVCVEMCVCVISSLYGGVC